MPRYTRYVNIENKEELVKFLKERTFVHDDHWLWRGPTVDGYGQVSINGTQYRINRLVAHVFLGLDMTSGLQANHKPPCSIRHCWNPAHLYIGTQYENMQDKIDKENYPCGHPRTLENTKYDKERNDRHVLGTSCKLCGGRHRGQRKMWSYILDKYV